MRSYTKVKITQLSWAVFIALLGNMQSLGCRLDKPVDLHFPLSHKSLNITLLSQSKDRRMHVIDTIPDTRRDFCEVVVVRTRELKLHGALCFLKLSKMLHRYQITASGNGTSLFEEFYDFFP